MPKSTVDVSKALARTPATQRKRKYIPNQRDIIFWDFLPQIDSNESLEVLSDRPLPMQVGHEQMYPRHALVMTERKINADGLALVIPITTQPKDTPIDPKPYVFSIPAGLGIKTRGFVLINQFKAIDITLRKPEYIERAPEAFFREVSERLSKLTSLPKNLN